MNKLSLWYYGLLMDYRQSLMNTGASLVAQRLKRLPAMRETWVRSLGWEDPLEKEMATHSSILAWRIPWTEELGGLQSMGRKESDTTERLHFKWIKLFPGWWYIHMFLSSNSLSDKFAYPVVSINLSREFCLESQFKFRPCFKFHHLFPFLYYFYTTVGS